MNAIVSKRWIITDDATESPKCLLNLKAFFKNILTIYCKINRFHTVLGSPKLLLQIQIEIRDESMKNEQKSKPEKKSGARSQHYLFKYAESSKTKT